MANIKITDLTQLETIPDEAILYFVWDGGDYKCTKADFLAGIAGGGGDETLQTITENGPTTDRDITVSKINIQALESSENNSGDGDVLGGFYIDSGDVDNPNFDVSVEHPDNDNVVSVKINNRNASSGVFDMFGFNNFGQFLIKKFGNTLKTINLQPRNGTIAYLDDIPVINENYLGTYTTLGALETAHATASPGNYAIVDGGVGVEAVQYIWDEDEGWIAGGGVGPTTTDALPEGTTNLYHTAARVRDAVLTGFTDFSATLVTASDTVISALGKLQGQLNQVFGILDQKVDVVDNPISLFLNADIPTTSTTSIPTNLSSAIAANEKKNYQAMLVVETPSGGIKIEIKAPTGAIVKGGSASGSTTSGTARFLNITENTLSIAVWTTAATGPIFVSFSVENSTTAGDVQVCFASAAGSNTKILKGSTLTPFITQTV